LVFGVHCEMEGIDVFGDDKYIPSLVL